MGTVNIVILGNKIPHSLQADLNEQTYRDFEVILAPEEGIVTAMNIALAKAKGEILVRIDTDVALTPTWLEELVKPFNDPTVAGVTGWTHIPFGRRENRVSIEHADKPNWFLRWMFDGRPNARAKIYKCGSVSYGSNFMEKAEANQDIDHLEGTNWAMRTELIRQVGGFDPAFDGVSEWFDTDCMMKILKQLFVLHNYDDRLEKEKYKLVYADKAILYHLVGEPTMNFDKRKGDWNRVRNWLRFHWRHSKFHPKKIIWLMFLIIFTIRSR